MVIGKEFHMANKRSDKMLIHCCATYSTEKYIICINFLQEQSNMCNSKKCSTKLKICQAQICNHMGMKEN